MFQRELESKEALEKYIQYMEKKDQRVDQKLRSKMELNQGLGISINTRHLFKEMMAESAKIDGLMYHAIFLLRGSGFQVGAITNNFVSMQEQAEASDGGLGLDFLVLDSMFDVLIESAVVQARKPDAHIFNLACQALDVHPTECVFLDDIKANLKGARALGMETIHVPLHNPGVALQELGALLGIDLMSTDKHTLHYQAGVLTQQANNIVVDMFGKASNPPVLFLHGGGQTRMAFERTAREVRERGMGICRV